MAKPETKTMKAVLSEGKPYHMTVKEVSKLKIQEPTDAIIRVTTAAICGSDLHEYHGVLGARDIPYVMVGIVHEVESQVTKFQVGDRVIIPDLFEVNSTTFIYGEGNAFGTNIGGCQAEFNRAPIADDILFAIAAGTDHELDYLLCSDIFATAWCSITSTGFQPGDTVAVSGAGPVGLLAAYSALLRGALRVYSVDHVEGRLGRAESIGAIPINLRKGDPPAQTREVEPNGVKRTSDCMGFERVNPKLKPEEGYILNDAVKATASGGGTALTRVYWHGPKDKAEPKQGAKIAHIPFDVSAWWLKNIIIAGGPVTAASQEPALIDLVTAGRARPSFVVDHIIRIDDAPEGYQLFSEHEVQKVAIDFGPRTNGQKRKFENGG